MAGFRHALAHRIPLYIPPYGVRESDKTACQDFETRMAEALKQRNVAEYERLSAEQLKLAKFQPWIQHSFGEGAGPVYFHPQLLADFRTVDEIAWKVLEQLDRRLE